MTARCHCGAPASHVCDCGATGCDAHRGCEHEPERLRPVAPTGVGTWRVRIVHREGDVIEESIAVTDIGEHFSGQFHAEWKGDRGAHAYAFGVTPREAALQVAWGRVPMLRGVREAEVELIPPGGAARAELEAAVRAYLATEHAHASSTQAERDADVFNALPRRAEDALRALAALVRS